MQLKGEGRAVAQQKQVKVLCIDNHASSNYACFLLARSGCNVNCASFFCDALELIHGSSYDVCLINDEFVRSDRELFKKLREAAGSTPFIYYSTVVYPFSPRPADQSGNTPETPVPITEVAIAVNRTMDHALPHDTSTSYRLQDLLPTQQFSNRRLRTEQLRHFRRSYGCDESFIG